MLFDAILCRTTPLLVTAVPLLITVMPLYLYASQCLCNISLYYALACQFFARPLRFIE
nr:MAG TPA: hypothetical protein [Caudoviricetes sp.]